MTRHVNRAATATLAAAAALALLGAGTAGAATEEVSVAASAEGNTVTLAVTNNTAADVHCIAFLARPGFTPETIEQADMLYTVGFVDGLTRPVQVGTGTNTLATLEVADGDYQVDWACTDLMPAPDRKTWGTELMLGRGWNAAPAFVSAPGTSSPVGSSSLFGS